MIVAFSEKAWEDYLYWQATDKATVKRLNALLNDMFRHPFEGIGMPEALKHEWSSYWSRRIDQEHRLVYKVSNAQIIIAQCRYLY